MVSETPARYVAFLRAINVGGRRVKMERLREIFRGLGLENVETFIASGNVIFDAREDARALESVIEPHLDETLGYRVDTFVRSVGELARVADSRPFGPSEPAGDSALYVAFLADPPGEDGVARLMARETDVDLFRVEGCEVYWLRRGGPGDSAFDNATLERTLGAPATVRNVNTVRRLAAKYRGAGEDA